MRFEWDEAKRLQNLKDHGVDFVDAHKVFAGPTFTFDDDRLWLIPSSYSRCAFRRKLLRDGRRQGRGGKPAWPTC